MTFKVKSEILGFENIKELELTKVDELFSTLRSTEDTNISFTLVNPQVLREYTFDIAQDVEELLEIQNEEDLMVYNIVVIQNPIDESRINFLAPLIFNRANNTMAQTILDVNDNQNFGVDEILKTYIK